MRRLTAIGLAFVSLALAGVPAASAAGPEGRYIVVLADEAATRGVLRAEDFRIGRVAPARVRAQVEALRGRRGVRPERVFTAAIPGFAARLTPAQVLALRSDPSVAEVVADEPVSLDDDHGTDRAAAIVTTTLDDGPVVPTGIRRVRADDSPIARIDGVDERVKGRVAVLDTGIAGHRDLVIGGGVNCTESGGRAAWSDRNGHGTHVAGTIGAIDNGRGVVGVAPGVELWSVRVLDANARGYMSWIICGLDFVARKRRADGGRFFDAASMSISGPLDSRGPCDSTRSPYQAATCRVVASGVPVVVAAGNKSRDARSYRPGAYENVITVSALADFDGRPGGEGRQADICPFYSSDVDDTFADFSNFGPDVDLIAPGKCILSTYLNGRYGWMSGTSMATPHVTGAVLLYRAQYPDAGPLQVKQALQAAGSFEWRTGTDPDGQPDVLLRVIGTGPPPTFALSIGDPVGWLGRDKRLAVPVDAGRQDGHREPITLSASGLPPGVSVERSVIRDRTGTLRLRSSERVESGEALVKVRGTDGELRSSATFTLRIDAQAPRGAFTTPVPGSSRLTEAHAQELAWTESDAGGSGVAGRTVQHQTAAIETPGSCEGVEWHDAGAPITAPSPATASDLAAGLCHRWRLRVLDGARNAHSGISGTSLIDTEPPPAATFSLSGEHVWLESPGGPGWFGSASAGSTTLTVRSRDPHAGTRELRTSGLEPSDGWEGPGARSTDGEPAVLDLSWSKGAPATSLRARAIDRLGHEGTWRTLELRPDDGAPVSADWTTPEPGTRSFSRGSVTLRYAGGSDAGSGIDPRALIGRRRGDVVSEGSCEGVTYAGDGQPVRLASGSEVDDLSSGSCYRWVLTSYDRVGNAGGSRASGSVLVDGIRPTVSFTAPEPGATRYEDDGRVAISLSLHERGGSGLASATLQRQVAPVTEPGSCEGAAWAADGTSRSLGEGTTSFDETGLLSGRCYRWTVRAEDRAGNERVVRSAPAIVDTQAPPQAEVAVADGAAWAEGPAGPVWFRAGVSGSFVLRSGSRQDADSGIAGTRFSGVDPSSGWSEAASSAAFVEGRPADRELAHGASAGDASIRLVTRDRAGNEGEPLAVELRADDRPPVIELSSPIGGTTRLPVDEVTISWQDRDPGSGVASRRLQQQRARVSGGRDCDGLDWTDQGPAFPAESGVIIDDLKPGWCYRWRLAVRDRVGNSARVTTGPVRLATDVALDVDDVRGRLVAGQLGRRGTVPARLGWAVEAIVASATGVRHDVVATRDGGATWARVARDIRATRLAVRLDPKDATVYAVRARDAAGHRSAWEESPALRARLVQESSTPIDWKGRWSRVKKDSASGGALRQTRSAGASARYRFEGSAIAIVSEVGPTAGRLVLRVDGAVVARPSLRRSSSSARRVLVVATFGTVGEHIIEVVADGGRVTLDAFVVLRSSPTSVQR
jgi:hypothetical protein